MLLVTNLTLQFMNTYKTKVFILLIILIIIVNFYQMENKKKMALLIVNHLKTQLNNGSFSDESLESMEVAVQCIESAYDLNPTESDNVEVKLERIVKEYYQVREQKVNICINYYVYKIKSTLLIK